MPQEDRNFVSPDTMPEFDRAYFLNLRFKGPKAQLTEQDLADIEKIRIALTIQRPSGLLTRPSFRVMETAIKKCEGSVPLLNILGKLTRMEIDTTGRKDPGNVLLKTVNTRLASVEKLVI